MLGASAYIPLSHYAGPRTIQRKVEDLGLDEIDDDVAVRVLERVRSEVRMRQREPVDSVFIEIVEEERAAN